MYIKFQFLGSGAQYLIFEMCLEGIIWHVCSYLKHKYKLLILSRLSDFMVPLLYAAERRGTPVREGFLYQDSAVGRVDL